MIHFEEGCKSAVIWKYFKIKKKKIGFQQGKPSRFWERKTLPRGSPTIASVVTVLKKSILFSAHAICLGQKKRSSRAGLFLLHLSTCSSLLFLSIYRIKNVFNLGFMCIILFLFCFTTAVTSTVSFMLCERKLKMVFGKEKQILRAIYCCNLKYENICRF